MDGERVQPTRISKEEYTLFKQFVQDIHGTTRGHLSTEIENALREYRQKDHERDKLARIEDDIATIKAQLATVESDGGATIPEPNAPAPGNGKPNKNAPRSEKVEWIIETKYNRNGGSVRSDVIKEQILSEFSFSESLAEEYVQLVLDSLDARRHPEVSDMFIWGDKIADIMEVEK